MDAASPPDDPPFLGLLARGRRLGAYTWVEQRCFELVGAWSEEADRPADRLVLAATSRHHGWRAEQLHSVLPDLADRSPDSLVVAPSPAVEAALRALGERSSPDGWAAALGISLLPGLIGAYAADEAACNEAADQPVARILHLVGADAARDLAIVRRWGGPAAVGEGPDRLEGLDAGWATVDERTFDDYGR